ncbi:MAG: SDR family oxidoreductase, partial [Candidatus Methylomirabilis sp.]|nr:SDR family oxidoreductase [Deltaproteobacteria bacterium]
MGLFDGKTALVTGGAGAGIGSHTAKRFAREGANVAIVDIHERRTKEVSAALQAEFPKVKVRGWQGDVADRARMDEVVKAVEKELGPIDLLVNNAAENVLAPVREFDPKDWDRVLGVDLTACFYLTRIILPGMI